MPQPQTASNALTDKIVSLLETGSQFKQNDSSLNELEHQSKQLAKANVAEGYIALAAISMLKGNFDEMRSRYAIARNQGLSPGQRLNYATALCHSGFFSEAQDIIKSSLDSLPDPLFAAAKAVMGFQFQLAIEMLAKADRLKLPIPEDFVNFKQIIIEMEDLLTKAGIDNATLVQSADLAGEVMREHHVYFKIMPLFSYSKNDDGVYNICTTFFVPTSFENASEMTYSYAEKMLSKGIGHDNFIIRFRGA